MAEVLASRDAGSTPTEETRSARFLTPSHLRASYRMIQPFSLRKIYYGL